MPESGRKAAAVLPEQAHRARGQAISRLEAGNVTFPAEK